MRLPQVLFWILASLEMVIMGAIKPEPIMDDLLDAIEYVESSNNPKATGDYRNGQPRAVGAYQLWTIYIDDVNRIAKTNYTYDCRWDRDKSREMTRIYLTHYGRVRGIKCLVTLSRLHNGGPNGHRQDSTLPYAQKIKEYFAKK